jgi:hypothetical protein
MALVYLYADLRSRDSCEGRGVIEFDVEQRARLADIAERTPMTLMLKQSVTIKTTLT